MNNTKTINIIIAALGGEGGGVLADWLTEVAISQGYLAQSTSVPGVAQRTGATIYYLELFPKTNGSNKEPVMSLFPTQGDIDIVIASEIIEAGRMVQRGFVTPKRTTLITSDHRVYAVGEKIIPGNGIAGAEKVREIAKTQAMRFIHHDMRALAHDHGTVISATLFGALAGSNALPFSRDVFEKVIRDTGKAVSANLAAFAASFDWVNIGDYDTRNSNVKIFTPPAKNPEITPFKLPSPTTANGAQLLSRIDNEFHSHCHELLYLGVKRLLIYQDANYANLYLNKLNEISPCKNDNNGELIRETARHLSLWMSYEDIIRVAEIKISPQRFQRFAQEINVEPNQYYNMVEFLRPQMEEYISVLPSAIAEKMLNSPFWKKLIGRFTKGKFVSTNKLSGFLQFYLLTKLKPLRRKGWGYKQEHIRIQRWLSAVKNNMDSDYDMAVELAKCGRLIKGYGNTRKKGHNNLSDLLDALEQETIKTAPQLAKLTEEILNNTNGEKHPITIAQQ